MAATVLTGKGPEERFFKADALLSPWRGGHNKLPLDFPFVLKILGPARSRAPVFSFPFIYFISVIYECFARMFVCVRK